MAEAERDDYSNVIAFPWRERGRVVNYAWAPQWIGRPVAATPAFTEKSVARAATGRSSRAIRRWYRRSHADSPRLLQDAFDVFGRCGTCRVAAMDGQCPPPGNPEVGPR